MDDLTIIDTVNVKLDIEEQTREAMRLINPWQSVNVASIVEARVMIRVTPQEGDYTTRECLYHSMRMFFFEPKYEKVEPILRLRAHSGHNYDVEVELAQQWLFLMRLPRIKFTDLIAFNIDSDYSIWRGFTEYCGASDCGKHPIEELIDMQYTGTHERCESPYCLKHAFQNMKEGFAEPRDPSRIEQVNNLKND